MISAPIPPRLRGSAAHLYLLRRQRVLGVLRERPEPSAWQRRIRRVADLLLLAIGTATACWAFLHAVNLIGAIAARIFAP